MPYKDRIKRLEFAKRYYENHKEAHNIRVSNWKKLHKEKVKQIRKKWRINNREKVNELQRNYMKRVDVKPKLRARKIASRKIKIPFGWICNRCHNRLATIKHHLDYSKPLKVVFLCRECHQEIHNLQRRK